MTERPTCPRCNQATRQARDGRTPAGSRHDFSQNHHAVSHQP